jgi:hypothetical protein
VAYAEIFDVFSGGLCVVADPGADSSSDQTEWPEVGSPQARGELTQLLIECANICRGMLQSFQPFTPFGLARRRRDGRCFLLGGVFMPSAVDDPITYILDLLHRTRANYTAVAVVHDIQSDDAPMMMRIYLEHIDGEAFRVWVPWRRLGDDNVRLQQPDVGSTQPLIWSDLG